MAIGALVLFLVLVLIGLGKRVLIGSEIAKGFFVLFNRINSHDSSWGTRDSKSEVGMY